jgi:hypothetical protein
MVAMLKKLFGFGEPYADVVEQIHQTAKLPGGWNTYGAGPVAEAARQNALMFVRRLTDVPRPPVGEPSVVPLANGGLALEWETDQRDVLLTFGPDGVGVYTVMDQGDDRVIAEGRLDRIDVKELLRHVIA